MAPASQRHHNSKLPTARAPCRNVVIPTRSGCLCRNDTDHDPGDRWGGTVITHGAPAFALFVGVLLLTARGASVAQLGRSTGQLAGSL